MGDISEEQQKLMNNMMFEAIYREDWERFQLCLSKGADLQARVYGGWTPLMTAVKYGKSDKWLDFLLQHDADLFAKDDNGQTVFDLVTNIKDINRRKEVTNKLIAALPSVDDPTKTEPAEDNALQQDIPVPKPLVFKKQGRSGPKLTP